MKLNERYGKPNAHYMKRLEEITRYAMDDYARILAFRVDLLLPVDNSHKGYDSAVITRFIASLKAQIAAYLQRRRRDGKRVYPCKLRYAWVREFGELNGNKHYHMLLLVNREVFRNTMLNTENSAQPRGLLAGMVARAWAVALRRTGDMANKAPFIYRASLMNWTAEMAQIRTFPQLHIPHQLSGEGVHQNTMMVNVTLVVVRDK